MDEHKTNGMTEFLRQELRAWENMGVGQHIFKANRQRRKVVFLIAAIVAATLLTAAAVVMIAPWNENGTRQPDNGVQGGGVSESTQESDSESEQSEGVTETETQEPESRPDSYFYDYSVVPAGATPIVPYNLATKNNPVNQTDRVIDMQDVMDAACLIPVAPGQICVLIIHTHTGEGYNREDALYLHADDEEFARSRDGSDGVIAIGDEMAKQLNAAGIGTVHCKTVFDGESNRESYARAADAIAAFRRAYPSLICVIDIHRAAMTDENGSIVRSLAVNGEQKAAQTQLICGMSAERTSKTNLALAMQLYQNMNNRFPDSCAGVICKEQTLNQDLVPFSLTMEIGSCGNTLPEALVAAQLASQGLLTLFDTN